MPLCRNTTRPPPAAGLLEVAVEIDVSIPMRDGVVLRANLYRPVVDGPYPALVVRTPYGKQGPGHYDRYVRAGYVVVCQDTRGRYASDGEFVPFFVSTPHEAEDGYDTVEWAAAQPWCDGRVGTMGLSYAGWMQWALAALRPPHLVAMAAQGIPLELTELDFPGTFRAGRRVQWLIAAMAPDLRRRTGGPMPHDTLDAKRVWDEHEHGHYLGMLPWSELPQLLPAALGQPLARWLRNPTERVWRFDQAHHHIDVPNLDITGWWDHCIGIRSPGGHAATRP